MNMKNWKIKTKLLFLVGVMAALLAGVSILGYTSLVSTVDQAEKSQGYEHESFIGARINTNAAVLSRIEFRLAAEPTPEQLAAALKGI